MDYLVRVCRGCPNSRPRHYEMNRAARGRDDIRVEYVRCLGYCAQGPIVDVIADGQRFVFGNAQDRPVRERPRPLTDLVTNIEKYVG